jgi:hypothetical protein
MLRLDLICFTKSGISAARMTRVRKMMDSAQDAPLSGPKIAPKTRCQPTSTTEIR